MTRKEILGLFLDRIPAEYPKHMLCFFAGHANRGNVLPFLDGLLKVLLRIESASPDYATVMLDRIAAITGKGEIQYERLIQTLAEIYVTGGGVVAADRESGSVLFRHEPGMKGRRNPEFEVRMHGNWCAVEVKSPSLIIHGRNRAQNDWQVVTRGLPPVVSAQTKATLPRDNPVKDFLISAEEKFQSYETYRNGAIRILAIVWDDFCYEPITALLSPTAGLLTTSSFHRTADNRPVLYPHVDGIIVIRYQHQIIRATRCEPLADGATQALEFYHSGFPPKAFIAIPGGRQVSSGVLQKLNAVPIADCVGAEYLPSDIVMWMETGG